VNLYGIESPGLTASLPLADEVVRKLANAPSEEDDEEQSRRYRMVGAAGGAAAAVPLAEADG
jgi:hypothetical protein